MPARKKKEASDYKHHSVILDEAGNIVEDQRMFPCKTPGCVGRRRVFTSYGRYLHTPQPDPQDKGLCSSCQYAIKHNQPISVALAASKELIRLENKATRLRVKDLNEKSEQEQRLGGLFA